MVAPSGVRGDGKASRRSRLCCVSPGYGNWGEDEGAGDETVSLRSSLLSCEDGSGRHPLDVEDLHSFQIFKFSRLACFPTCFLPSLPVVWKEKNERFCSLFFSTHQFVSFLLCRRVLAPPTALLCRPYSIRSVVVVVGGGGGIVISLSFSLSLISSLSLSLSLALHTHSGLIKRTRAPNSRQHDDVVVALGDARSRRGARAAHSPLLPLLLPLRRRVADELKHLDKVVKDAAVAPVETEPSAAGGGVVAVIPREERSKKKKGRVPSSSHTHHSSTPHEIRKLSLHVRALYI